MRSAAVTLLWPAQHPQHSPSRTSQIEVTGRVLTDANSRLHEEGPKLLTCCRADTDPSEFNLVEDGRSSPPLIETPGRGQLCSQNPISVAQPKRAGVVRPDRKASNKEELGEVLDQQLRNGNPSPVCHGPDIMIGRARLNVNGPTRPVRVWIPVAPAIRAPSFVMGTRTPSPGAAVCPVLVPRTHGPPLPSSLGDGRWNRCARRLRCCVVQSRCCPRD